MEKSNCSEEELLTAARELARELGAGALVQLEGPLGSGKSVFARALLEALGIARENFAGSPTFPLVHEYDARQGAIAHVDLYRIDSEADARASGVDQVLCDPLRVVLVEWLSKFPEMETRVLAARTGRVFRVELDYSVSDPGTLRSLRVLES